MNLNNKMIIGILLCLLGIFIVLMALFITPKTTPKPMPNATAPNAEQLPTSNLPTTPQNSYNQNDYIWSKDEPVGKLDSVHGVGDGHLVAVPAKFSQKDERIHQDVLDPLLGLIANAEQDGVHLFIVSAYRSYNHQKRIWDRKWGSSPNDDLTKAQEVLSYSSFPGTSRHHWGTDVDFNSVNPEYWQGEEGQKVHAWLQKNAPRYGFCQTYSDNRTGGYSTEEWHWSHLPTARPYYDKITDPKVFKVIFAQGVKGSEAVNQLNLIDYVTTIDTCGDVK